jgi:hypothetical protein
MILFEDVQLFSLKETATILDVTPQTVRKMVKRGLFRWKIVARRIFVYGCDLREYLKSSRQMEETHEM